MELSEWILARSEILQYCVFFGLLPILAALEACFQGAIALLTIGSVYGRISE